ncbi:MAG: hypothetical protein Q8M86_04460 [Syntrophales bacterium]|nr:hypothetical protein [Syntrophales bacterium]MDP3097177.1 hypothetical protein [Syntrophales bacterium]
MTPVPADAVADDGDLGIAVVNDKPVGNILQEVDPLLGRIQP